MKKTRSWTLALSSAALLAACGGGGGGSEDTGPAPLVTGTVNLTGVVSVAAVLPQAAVEVKCAAGTATATTKADGTYEVSLANASLPCVVGATSSDTTTTLHSVATGPQGDANVVANVTSLTELTVAQLAGTSPEAFFNTVTPATLAGAVTAAKVVAAQDKVKVVLDTAGIDTSGLGNFVTDTLVINNPYGQVLVLLDQTMATAGSNLSQLTTTVATSAAGAGTTGNVTTPTTTARATLPADLLLKPKAADCAALRSTSYRVLHLKYFAGPGNAWDDGGFNEKITVDAPTLEFTYNTNGASEVWTSTGNCTFTDPTATDTIVVAQSGVMVGRGANGDGTFHMFIGLPEQSITVADTAGTWNVMYHEVDNVTAGVATFSSNSPIGTFASSGQLTSAVCVDGDPISTLLASCTTAGGILPRFEAASGGALTFLSTDPADQWQERTYGFRAGNGDLLLVTQPSDGGLGLFTKQRTLSLPSTVNNTASSWNLSVGGNGQADAGAFNTRTIKSVDAATQSYVRTNQVGITTIVNAADAHDETVFINKSRPGYQHRPAGSSTSLGGPTVSFREWYLFGLNGMGVSALSLTNNAVAPAASNARFMLSVTLP